MGGAREGMKGLDKWLMFTNGVQKSINSSTNVPSNSSKVRCTAIGRLSFELMSPKLTNIEAKRLVAHSAKLKININPLPPPHSV